MKANLAALLFSFLALVAPIRATVLPDSCGADKVKFDVKTSKSLSAPAAPADGKALIVLIQTENQIVSPFSGATIRFGMDGAWVGANNGNSYFTLAVDPGQHHLCVSWQSVFPQLKRNVDLTSFTAEPGKTYYFAAAVDVVSREDVEFGLSAVNDDKGSYLVKAAKVSTWTSK
jgi:hypothetical protein